MRPEAGSEVERAPSSRWPGLLVGASVPAVLGGLLVGLLTTGAAGASLVDDPGALTRWGLPLVRGLSDLAAALTVGLLVVAAYIVPAAGWAPDAGDATAAATGRSGGVRSGGGRSGGGRSGGGRSSAVGRLGGLTLVTARMATVTGTFWVLCSAVVLVLSYASISGTPVTGAGFAEQLAQFAPSIQLLRSLLLSTLLAAVAVTGTALATRHSTMGWMALVALLALVPLALTGHGGGHGHELAVDALAAHLVGVSVWVGALAALALLRPRLGAHLPVAVRRYSTLALCCFVLVGVSGLVNAFVGLGAWSALASSYGALVVAKAVALLLLAVIGWRHRRSVVGRLERGEGRAFWRLVGAELSIMGIAIGLGVALSASEPPVPAVAPAQATLAEALTGYPLPGPLTALSWLTAWRLDLLWAGVAAVLAGAYLVGVRRMAARGDRWPVLRTLAWLSGCLVLVWVTSGAPGSYGRVLFSAHMLGHMTLSMVVPPLLVLGAPVTLAMRTMTARRDGSRGPREWLLAVVHSRALTVLSHPVVAAGIFAVSLVVFYYSPLFELSLRTHTGHVLMTAHFLLAGYLFASVLIGVDPGPARPAYPLRLLVLFATMAFHAFFGVALTQGTSLLAPDVLTQLGRTWGRSPLADQLYGGAIAWGLGELPTLLLGMGVALAWVRSDDRESRRSDRAADRDGDAELAEYNTHLAAMAERSARAERSQR